jgi:hypothetical protein
LITAKNGLHYGTVIFSIYIGPEHVIFGHDSRRFLQEEKYATGLDTGCCFGNYLTAVIYPGGKIVQIKAKKQYSNTE